jgi:RND family efflux transporter MFP subunit
VLTIDATPFVRDDFTVMLRSQGTVHAPTRSTLAVEIGGRVIAVSPHLQPGDFVSAGEVLVQIDTRELAFELARLTAELQLAEHQLSENEIELTETQKLVNIAAQQYALATSERARISDLAAREIASPATLDEARRTELSAQARHLELAGNVAQLAARTPRLGAAIAVATSRVQRAQLDLERATLRAPYAGRVEQRYVDVGAVIARGASITTIHGIEAAEVRLPLPLSQLAFLELNELQRDSEARPQVTLAVRRGDQHETWQGELVRTEGEIDAASRQLYVVARIHSPYPQHDDRLPLLPGTFVSAEIHGRVLHDSIIVPRESLQPGDELLVVLASGDRLERRKVEVIWRDSVRAILRGGLAAGERLCTTPVVFGGRTVPVRLRGERAKR